MASKTPATLAQHIAINRHYQRSIRLDFDYGRADALEGYICHGTAQTVLESMTRQLIESNQRAFTWTGPFGGGKSSLALAIASALSTDHALRAKARAILNIQNFPAFDTALPVNKGWAVIPVVGKRGSVLEEVQNAAHQALGLATPAKTKRKISSAHVLELLSATASSPDHDGVMLVIDEMGKFLEASAQGGDDVYFFQELAETAARSQGRFVVIGILHQSFKQYAARLGQEIQADWDKVQGRFVNIPLVAASDEVVELVGKAVACDFPHPKTLVVAEQVAERIRYRRTNIGPAFAARLDECWPLHPAMAALLGPISKRQFGQNERSTFGFLSLAEPYGFRAFLEATPATAEAYYRPNNYWDFLRANLETAIMASSDGHRWAQAVEAVERTEAHESALHVSLIKNIAIIDLFRNGSGLAADDVTLKSLYSAKEAKAVEQALTDLQLRKIAIFRKHTGAWSVFEGSDFDINAAVAQARSALAELDLQTLMQYANLHPIVAKQHYHQFGTLRWMSVTLCHLSKAADYVTDYAPQKGEFGQFVLVIPGQQTSVKSAIKQCRQISETRSSDFPVILGAPDNFEQIVDLGYELISLQKVADSSPELSGDSVARREVYARLADIKTGLENALRDGFAQAHWIGNDIDAKQGVYRLASELANKLYHLSPRLVNELVNRDSLSSNSVKARRDLLYRMLNDEAVAALGIEGYPAERGLYESLLLGTGLHAFDEATQRWKFSTHQTNQGERFLSLWRSTDRLFKGSDQRVPVTAVYALWSAAPFGLRTGLHPVLLVAYLLANRESLAIYKDGMFVPKLSEADIDECLQDARRFTLRWVSIDTDRSKMLDGIAEILADINGSHVAPAPLEAARGLVSLVLGLPMWAQRSQRLTDKARIIRDTLLKANDPHKVLFVDLMAHLEAKSASDYLSALREPLIELSQAYDRMLSGIMDKMIVALDAVHENYEQIRARAAAVAGITGDFRLDAFAKRLASYDGSREVMEGILSLAANRPPRDWNDRDIDSALLAIADWALKFRQAEALVAVQGREPTREAIAIVIGTGGAGRTVKQSFDIAETEKPLVKELAELIQAQLKGKTTRREVILAALAEAGLAVADSE